MENKVIRITGTASGCGNLTAKTLVMDGPDSVIKMYQMASGSSDYERVC